MPLSLGQLLVQEEYLTETQLEKALDYRKENRARLGDACIKLDFITEEDLLNILALQFQIPRIELEHFNFDSDAIDLLDKDMARNCNAIPLYFIEDELMLAITDPLNITAVDEISRSTGKKVNLAISAPSEINSAIQTFYSVVGQQEEIPSGNGEGEPIEVSEENEEEVIEIVDAILKDAVESGVSDIHLEHREKSVRVRFRIDGILRIYKGWPKSKAAAIVSRFKVMAAIDIAETRKPQDGRFAFRAGKKEVDLRVNTYPSVYGEKVVMRILDPTKGAIPLEKLGFSTKTMKQWEAACSHPNGIVLVTGPTGSGKSTTLYATLNLVNSIDIHMITVEDPVEYKFDGIVQGQINERAGMTFAAALRAMLRQDPDIIMVGEMRDRETIDLAIRAALTGHLVFSTLHTNNASASYSRLMDMGTDPFMLSTTVRAIIAQRLIRRLCSKCKVRYRADEEEFETIEMPPTDEPLYKANEDGCSYCGERGYRGRAGLYELLIPSPELNELVQQRHPDNEIHKIAVKQGMSTLENEGYNFIKQGVTSIEEIHRVL